MFRLGSKAAAVNDGRFWYIKITYRLREEKKKRLFYIFGGRMQEKTHTANTVFMNDLIKSKNNVTDKDCLRGI